MFRQPERKSSSESNGGFVFEQLAWEFGCIPQSEQRQRVMPKIAANVKNVVGLDYFRKSQFNK